MNEPNDDPLYDDCACEANGNSVDNILVLDHRRGFLDAPPEDSLGFIEMSCYRGSSEFPDVEMTIGEDATMHDLTEMFRVFALALGYHPDLVNDFLED